MYSWIKAAAVAVAVVATPIVAQETLGSSGGPPPGRGGGGGMGMMRMADANGDGVVTRDEYLAATDARFARMDRNGDGVLDETERPQRRGPPPGRDGAPSPGGMGGRKMTREQFHVDALRRFDRLDTNHDGKVDQNEMAAAATLTRARRADEGERGETAPPPPSPGE